MLTALKQRQIFPQCLFAVLRDERDLPEATLPALEFRREATVHVQELASLGARPSLGAGGGLGRFESEDARTNPDAAGPDCCNLSSFLVSRSVIISSIISIFFG